MQVRDVLKPDGVWVAVDIASEGLYSKGPCSSIVYRFRVGM